MGPNNINKKDKGLWGPYYLLQNKLYNNGLAHCKEMKTKGIEPGLLFM